MQGENLAVNLAASHVLDPSEQDQVALVVYDNTIQALAQNINITHGTVRLNN
jgi:hypothetical protein